MPSFANCIFFMRSMRKLLIISVKKFNQMKKLSLKELASKIRKLISHKRRSNIWCLKMTRKVQMQFAFYCKALKSRKLPWPNSWVLWLKKVTKKVKIKRRTSLTCSLARFKQLRPKSVTCKIWMWAWPKQQLHQYRLRRDKRMRKNWPLGKTLQRRASKALRAVHLQAKAISKIWQMWNLFKKSLILRSQWSTAEMTSMV